MDIRYDANRLKSPRHIDKFSERARSPDLDSF